MWPGVGVIFLLPSLALASAQGSWQASVAGPNLVNRNEVVASRPLAPRQPASGQMGMVVWQVNSNGAMPVGMQTRLCSLSRCVVLEGMSGQTRGFIGVNASEPLRFLWLIPGQGRLPTPWKVRGVKVIVNTFSP